MKLFSDSKKWYKANLHTHTTLSDGKKTPEECEKIYKDHGYNVLALTEHRKTYISKEEDNFILLCSTELDTFYRGNGLGEHYHILGYGLPENYRFTELTGNNHPQELIDMINNLGGIPVLAHPNWSLNRPSFVATLKDIEIAEIFNSISGVPFNVDRYYSGQIFDLTALAGKRLNAFGSDDSHKYEGEECQSWTMIQPDEFTIPGILQAMRDGKFYASRGPEFYQIELDEEKVFVKCSKCVRAEFYSELANTPNRTVVTPEGSCEYVYKFHQYEPYIRIEIVDEKGNKACSNFMLTGK